jgi:phosphatidylglycerophosphatase A
LLIRVAREGGKTVRQRLVLALATLGGVGCLPAMPGTWGSLAAVPVWWLLSHLGLWGYGLALAAVLALSIPVTGLAQEYLGPDHPTIVLDEMAGLLIALAGVPGKWPWIIMGFALFRLLDIWKPFPIKYVEKLPGGWGVVGDDAVAGLMARAALGVVMVFWGRG